MNTVKFMLFSAFVLSAALQSASSAMPDSAAFVNPWIGTGGTGAIHESHSSDDDRDFTRGWFAWADGLFAEAVLHALDMGVDFNKNF